MNFHFVSFYLFYLFVIACSAFALPNKPHSFNAGLPLSLSSFQLGSRIEYLDVMKSFSPSSSMQLSSINAIDPVSDANLPKTQTDPLLAQSRADLGSFSEDTSFSYHNGVLFVKTIQVYHVYYGDWNSNPERNRKRSIFDDLVRKIDKSFWWNTMTGQFTDGSGASVGNNVILNSTIVDSSFDFGTTITVDIAVQILASAVVNRQIPLDPSGIYILFTADNIFIPGMCQEFCSFHSFITIPELNGLKFAFGVVTDTTSQCPMQCANILPGIIMPNAAEANVDGIANALVHELFETATDPFFDGWFVTGTDDENADKCTWQYGQVSRRPSDRASINARIGNRDFLLQTTYDRKHSRCINAACPPGRIFSDGTCTKALHNSLDVVRFDPTVFGNRLRGLVVGTVWQAAQPFLFDCPVVPEAKPFQVFANNQLFTPCTAVIRTFGQLCVYAGAMPFFESERPVACYGQAGGASDSLYYGLVTCDGYFAVNRSPLHAIKGTGPQGCLQLVDLPVDLLIFQTGLSPSLRASYSTSSFQIRRPAMIFTTAGDPAVIIR